MNIHRNAHLQQTYHSAYLKQHYMYTSFNLKWYSFSLPTQNKGTPMRTWLPQCKHCYSARAREKDAGVERTKCFLQSDSHEIIYALLNKIMKSLPITTCTPEKQYVHTSSLSSVVSTHHPGFALETEAAMFTKTSDLPSMQAFSMLLEIKSQTIIKIKMPQYGCSSTSEYHSLLKLSP